MKYLKIIFRYFVFNNVWIALCALSMLVETQWFFEIPFKWDALAAFIFFGTFFDYNHHRFSWHFNPSHPFADLKRFFSSEVSNTLRISILVGFAGTAISFVLLDPKIIPVVLLFSIITLAYSLPMIKWKNKFMRLREITYLKIFVVAFVWSFVTVIIPLMYVSKEVSYVTVAIVFLRRLLFIYAITIPFEIRGIEIENSYGNRNLPMIYGVRRMKIVGIIFMGMFCLLSAVHELYFEFNITDRQNIFLPLLISAIVSGMLIAFYNSKRSEWYNAFFVDGMMILQLLLLLIFNTK